MLIRMDDATEQLLLLERLLGPRFEVGQSDENYFPWELHRRRLVPWMRIIEVVTHAWESAFGLKVCSLPKATSRSAFPPTNPKRQPRTINA